MRRLLAVLFVGVCASGGIAAAQTVSLGGTYWKNTPPPPPDRVHSTGPLLWGFADFHTHVMTHMGFGGIKPEIAGRPIWGVPGTSFDDYVGDFPRRRVADDIPPCVTGHGGGPAAELVIDTVEERFADRGIFSDLWQVLHGNIHDHDHRGGPGFESFPSFTSGMHQQMHITQIHRAWEGGLRLMTAIAVHNRGLEYMMSRPKDGHIDPSADKDVIEAQVCGIGQLAHRNSSWMKIAYSPDDARRIIARGRLAVVLGVEVDSLGRLGGFEGMASEVDYLWNLGIRQVTPVHAVNNRLGGAAIFQPIYNAVNDLLYRGQMDLGLFDLSRWPARFFQAAEGCPSHGPLGWPGECILYRFDNDKQPRAVLTRWSLPNLFRLAPFYTQVPGGYPKLEGMMNADGLTWDGAVYLRELMKRGMLIGLEHMGQRTVDDAYQVVAADLARTDPDCAGFGRREVKAPCYDRAYPFIFAHAHFRELSAQKRDLTTVESFLPSEYEVGLRELDLLRRTGGVVGQFTAEDPVYPAMPTKNDCGGSSKSTAFSLEYAVSKMQGFGVGLATDFTLIRGTAPRFGDNKCAAYQVAPDPDRERTKHPDQYNPNQKNPVQYRGEGGAEGLERYYMGGRGYNFNEDGLAHYGLLPDLLQDMSNVGLSPAAFGSLFSSAEAYVETWEKAELLAGGPHSGVFKPKNPACEKVCHGLCPDDPNAGAPTAKRSTRRLSP